MISKSLLMAALIFAPSWLGLENGLLEENVPEPQKDIPKIEVPVKTGESLGVKITAEAALAIDKKTGAVLFSKNPYDKRAMASTTKIMTTLVALESGKDIEDVVTINDDVIGIEGAKIKLLKDEQLTFRDLIRGALISSGNDAAYATALYAADGDIDAFVEMMNRKAVELGLRDTHFSNPHGLDAEGHYTTAKDLAKLFAVAVKNPIFHEIIGTKKGEAHALNTDKVHYLNNTNKLLSETYPYMLGAKTGFTDNAGFCLVSLSGTSEDNEIITVVLGSDLSGNQFQDSKTIIEWVYMNYSWKK